MELEFTQFPALLPDSSHRPGPVICLHHFLSTFPSFLAPLLHCCKKQKRVKKMRKSSSDCSSSSSVPGQVFVGFSENLWTLFAISEMGPGQWAHCSPCPTDLLPHQMFPWESFTWEYHTPEVSQAHQGGKHLSVHARDSQNEPFVWFWKTILASLTSRPVAGPPAACLAQWVSATPSLGSAACFPDLWMLPPL